MLSYIPLDLLVREREGGVGTGTHLEPIQGKLALKALLAYSLDLLIPPEDLERRIQRGGGGSGVGRVAGKPTQVGYFLRKYFSIKNPNWMTDKVPMPMAIKAKTIELGVVISLRPFALLVPTERAGNPYNFFYTLYA